MIANLLNNSAKYTKPGGQIWLTAERQDNYVGISIRDNGIGIPAKMLPNIFQMFTQVDTEHKGAQAGLGIGLALVKTLVEMHGGRVEVHSDGVDQGSTFTILLPLAACGTATDPGIVERVSSRICRPNRVLVVDDNADAAFSLGMLLKIQGSEVHTVNDGLSALDAVKNYQPSVILLDIGMPGLSGYEVARRIREQPQYDSITLVAVTGWAQEEDRKRTRAAGFAHHLVKPVDLAALQALLASLESGQTADCLM
jgi:CheY-like chemotaxis protein